MPIHAVIERRRVFEDCVRLVDEVVVVVLRLLVFAIRVDVVIVVGGLYVGYVVVGGESGWR